MNKLINILVSALSINCEFETTILPAARGRLFCWPLFGGWPRRVLNYLELSAASLHCCPHKPLILTLKMKNVRYVTISLSSVATVW